ncbi:type VII secretion protein EccB [Sinosporangium album]|uniref:Type VII secretion protein EccB n=1 Tax=Sinosporangium album TaxID=504805 RepID=A0A1G7YXW3_9ACTN|nr:type VII secretion protein EccB [Sinosporangium album]SDH00690.1 type VII secretion protein EccB [Sinosporangium album]
MQTRKDLYQAHRLMVQRMGMALLQGEPDVPESPMRRQNVAMFSGVLIAVLIVAGFGIWGLLKPGNATKLEEPGQLLIEEETGAAYVYSQERGQLLPAANYVSARLLLDANQVKVRNVTAASLAAFRRGPTVGIAGAPDSLPAKDKLVKGPWSACIADGPAQVNGRKTYVTLVGGQDVGGRPVGGAAIAVRDDQRQAWVLWNDRRMRISADGLRSLGATTQRNVPATWINAIPEGPEFRARGIADRGRKVPGAGKVGQVFKAPAAAGAPERWYVLLQDGYAQITVTEARLLLDDKQTKRAYGSERVAPIDIDTATANATVSKQQANTGLPATMPQLITPPSASPICAVYADTQKGSMKATLAVGGTMTVPAPRTGGGTGKLDQVVLPPGTAAVAGRLPGENLASAINTYFLITDQGRQFPLKTPEVLEKLGYDSASVAPVPGNLLDLIPQGPVLDPAAALAPIQQ